MNNSNDSNDAFSFFKKLNDNAVKNMTANSTNQNALNNIMSSTIKQAEEHMGRPMTYAEMRERFG